MTDEAPPLRPAAFAVGYLAAYFLSSVLPTPLVWYFPVERRFALAVHPGGVGSDFYGRVLLCLGVGALAALLVRPSWAGRRAAVVLTGWIASLVIFSAGLLLFILFYRQVFPLPLPPGYVPR